jgi:hypothetical protein
MSHETQKTAESVPRHPKIVLPKITVIPSLRDRQRLKTLKETLSLIVDNFEKDIHLMGDAEELTKEYFMLMENGIKHEKIEALYTLVKKEMAEKKSAHLPKSEEASPIIKGSSTTLVKEDKKSSLLNIQKFLLKRERLKSLSKEIAYILINIQRYIPFKDVRGKLAEECLTILENTTEQASVPLDKIQPCLDAVEQGFHKTNAVLYTFNYANVLVTWGYMYEGILQMLEEAFQLKEERSAEEVQSAKTLLSNPHLQQWLQQQAIVGEPPLQHLITLLNIPSCPVRDETIQLLKELVATGNEMVYKVLTRILTNRKASVELKNAIHDILTAAPKALSNLTLSPILPLQARLNSSNNQATPVRDLKPTALHARFLTSPIMPPEANVVQPGAGTKLEAKGNAAETTTDSVTAGSSFVPPDQVLPVADKSCGM